LKRLSKSQKAITRTQSAGRKWIFRNMSWGEFRFCSCFGSQKKRPQTIRCVYISHICMHVLWPPQNH